MTAFSAIEDVVDIRFPYWLNRDDRALLDSLLRAHLTATTYLSGDLPASFKSVLIELGVAEARDRVWPQTTRIVRNAFGHDADVLPIRMSDTERDAVLSIQTLPERLRQALRPRSE